MVVVWFLDRYTFELVEDDGWWPMIDNVLEPGWDVMEPLTYVTGSGLSLLAFGWFCLSRTEFGYDSIRARWVKSRFESACKRQGFDAGRYEQLRAQLLSFDRLLLADELARFEQCPPRAAVSVDNGET